MAGVLAFGKCPQPSSFQYRWNLSTLQIPNAVNLSMDIRNAIHGLEVWPYNEAV